MEADEATEAKAFGTPESRSAALAAEPRTAEGATLAPSNAKRRVLEEGLLDELQALSQVLLTPPSFGGGDVGA